MTTTLHAPDYVAGETFEQHLRRHGCILRVDEWDAIVNHHEIAELPDPQHAAEGSRHVDPDHVDELVSHVVERYTAAVTALESLVKVVAAVRQQRHAADATARAEVAFTAFALLNDSDIGGRLVDETDADKLLGLAADARTELLRLLLHAGDVTESDGDGAPDDEDIA